MPTMIVPSPGSTVTELTAGLELSSGAGGGSRSSSPSVPGVSCGGISTLGSGVGAGGSGSLPPHAAITSASRIGERIF